jgi:hypothetical protein
LPKLRTLQAGVEFIPAKLGRVCASLRVASNAALNFGSGRPSRMSP